MNQNEEIKTIINKRKSWVEKNKNYKESGIFNELITDWERVICYFDENTENIFVKLKEIIDNYKIKYKQATTEIMLELLKEHSENFKTL